MFDEDYYSEIGQSLAELHEKIGWDTIYYHADIEEQAVGYFIFFSTPDHFLYPWTSLYERFGYEKSVVDSITLRISDTIRRFNDAYATKGHERWTILSFILNNDGSFHTDLSYENLDDTCEFDRRHLWRQHYLPKDHKLIL